VSPIDHKDPLLEAIGALPAVRPGAEHAERVRGRCHAALDHGVPRLPISLEPVTVGTICALYAWHVVKIATRLPLP
jgi:hypothetical protein